MTENEDGKDEGLEFFIALSKNTNKELFKIKTIMMLIEYYYQFFKYPIIFTGMMIDLVQPIVFIISLYITEQNLNLNSSNVKIGLTFSWINVILVIG